MLRPDYALQLWMRTLPPENQHQNPEYMTLVAAAKELQRLYKMEMFAKDLVKRLEGFHSDIVTGAVKSDIDMVAGCIEDGKKSWLED